MLPGEMVILLAIVEATDFGRKIPTHSLGNIPGEYVDHLCGSLVRRSYLKRNSLGGYQLTSKGRESLIEFLDNNTNIVKDMIKKLGKIRIKVSPEIDKVEKEAMGVK